ncbi:MAG TPA: ATP-binding protein [Opitutaceae bacterium]
MDRASPPRTWLPAGTLALLQATPTAAALLLHADGRWQVAATNRAADELLGLPIDEQAEPRLLDCLDDAHEHAFLATLATCIERNTAGSVRVVARRADNDDAVMLEARLSPIPAPSGSPDGASWLALHLQPAVRPVTSPESRAFYEDGALRAALLAISRATHRATDLGTLFDEIHRIIVQFVGTDNLYIALVDETEQMVRFVYQRDQYDAHRDRPLGRLGVTDIVYHTGRPLLIDRGKADRMLAEGTVVNHGVPAQVWLGVPLRVCGRTIGVLAVQDYHTPHLLGEAERLFLTFISDQIAHAIAMRRTEAEAARHQTEAERSALVKSALIAGMNHDLRTPLSIVLGYGGLLAESLQDPADAAQARAITTAARELEAMVARILAFSTVEAGAQPLNETEVDIEELALICHSTHFDAAQAKGLDLTIKQEGSLPTLIRTDPEIIRQILLELITNAVKFTARGRVTLRVRAEAPITEQGRMRIVFTVEDTGPGIPPEIVNRLFQPALRASGHARPPGSAFGLGLTMCHRLARQIGGRLSVESTPGAGSVFRLTLPTTSSREAGTGPNRATVLLQDRLADRETGILVAGGSDTSQGELAGLVLEVTGCPPHLARSGEEAADLCQTKPIDIVIISVAPGEPIGPEMCLRLQTIPTLRGRVYTIVTGADHSVANVDRWLKAGADCFLPRPLGAVALLTALLSALDVLDRRSLRSE